MSDELLDALITAFDAVVVKELPALEPFEASMDTGAGAPVFCARCGEVEFPVRSDTGVLLFWSCLRCRVIRR